MELSNLNIKNGLCISLGANIDSKFGSPLESLLICKPKIEEIAIGYGKLIEAGVDFLIIALTVFLVVKVMNQMKQKADDPKNKTVATPKNIELMTKTNELLEKQNAYLMKLLDK